LAEEKQDQQIEAQEAGQNEETSPLRRKRPSRLRHRLKKPRLPLKRKRRSRKEKRKENSKTAEKKSPVKESPKNAPKDGGTAAWEKRKRESFGDLLVYPGVRSDLPTIKSGDVIKVA
jgi:hypothetical protein